MNQRKDYKFGDIHGSQVAIGDNSKTSQAMETNASEKKQTLAEAAAEIQSLLKQLESTYPTDTYKGKVALADAVVEQIDKTPSLTRIFSALKAGSISALDSLLDHPAASFVIGALEDWQNNNRSKAIDENH
jgi:hypothetical protein